MGDRETGLGRVCFTEDGKGSFSEEVTRVMLISGVSL